MINLEIAQFLVTIISFLLAYVISTTCVGVFRAWVADKMGDDTGKSLGFTKFNPLRHADPIGIIFLFIFKFGWGRHVPINVFNIEGPRKILKLACAYLSRPFGHLSLAMAGVSGLVMTFGTRVLSTVILMIDGRSFILPRDLLTRDFPQAPSLALSVAFILLVIVYLNVMLGVLDLIIDGVYLGFLVFRERSTTYFELNNFTLILLPLILVLVFSEVLRSEVVIPFIYYFGRLVAFVFGIP